jgi:hypothetical protein
VSDELTTSSLKDLVSFPFKQRDWLGRFLVGVLLYAACFVPLLGLVASVVIIGYIIQIMRQASQGEELSMPAWDDWGGLFKDGLQGVVVNIVYLLPGFIVFYGGMFLYFALFFGVNLFLPFAAQEGSDASLAAFAILFIVMFFGSFVIMFLSMGLGLLLMMLGMVPLPMALAHFSAQGSLSVAFRVKEWWPLLRANKLGYFVAWVIVTGVGSVVYLMLMPLIVVFSFAFILVPMGMLLFYVVLAPVYFYVSLVAAAVFGRTYRESVALAEPL